MNDGEYRYSMKKDTILCLEDSDFWRIVFSDLIALDNVYLLDSRRRWESIESCVVRKLCKIHHSFRMNSFINLPFKQIWKSYDQVYRLKDGIQRWIFTDTSIRGYDKEVLDELRNRGIHMYILFLNPMSSLYETRYALELVRASYFDMVYTVDKQDAERYEFIYTNTVYSKMILPEDECCSWKISYVGAAKDRLEKIHRIASILQKTRSMFYVTGVKKQDMLPLCNIVYNQSIKYGEVLRIVNKSETILEIIQKGQCGFTFRTYEALCYNKKLLTNNRDIKEQPFYDPEYIKVFSEIDDSVLEFINSDKIPNYHYANQYSPSWLLEDILEREENEMDK